MTAMVALLRGVNVGGRSLPMAQLRAAANACGYHEVATYLQSGNVVMATGTDDPAEVGPVLAAAIEAESGLQVELAVRTATEFDRIVAANPFAGRTDDPTHLHVAFHLGLPAPPPDWYDATDWEPEELAVVDGETYLYLPGGMGRSRLAVEVSRRGDRVGGARATARNWRTVLKLQELLAQR